MAEWHKSNEIVLQKWLRVSPIAIVYFVLKFTVQTIKHAVQGLLPLGIVLFTTNQQPWFWIALAGVGFVLLMVLFSCAYWWNYRFCIDDEGISLQSGIISKSLLNLKVSRIQNVHIVTPFYFQPFGLVNCVFDSAGSSKSEVNLPGVSLTVAQAMQQWVYQNDEMEEDAKGADQEQDKKIAQEIKFGDMEVAKYGLMSNMAFVALAVLAPFSEAVVKWMSHTLVPLVSQWTELFIPSVELAKVVALLIVIVSIPLSLWFFSIIGAVVRFNRFVFTPSPRRLARVAGMFERQQIALSKQKIQSIQVSTNWMGRLLKRVSLSYKQVSTGPQRQKSKGSKSLLIPVLQPERVSQFIHYVLPQAILPTRYTSPSIAYFRRVWIGYVCLPFSLLVLSFALLLDWTLAWAWIGNLVFLALGWLRYRRWGLKIDAELGYLRSGLLGYRIVVFELFKVQQVAIRQTPSQRRKGLANLSIQLACGRYVMPYLSYHQAKELADLILYKVESQQQAWM